jgi:4'-phosphopantetheinyl transferase
MLSGDILSEEERDRVRRYRYETDARRYLLSRHMLRTLLAAYLGREPGSIVFEPGLNGKPRLRDESPDGLRFNMSHSGDMAVLAVIRGREVGVDIEALHYPAPDTGAFRAFFSPCELSSIEACAGGERATTFYRTWTRKEALLKATGEGLGGMDADLDLSSGDDLWRHGVSWHVRDLDLQPEYAAAIAVEGAVVDVELKEWRGLSGKSKHLECLINY